MPLIRSCKEYLGFDDRRLMLVGIPLLALLMPILLDLSYLDHKYGYWSHQVPESLFFVAGFWAFYRWLTISLRKRFPKYVSAAKRITLQVVLMFTSAPILKVIFGWIAYAVLFLCNITDHEMPGMLQTMISIYLPSFLIVAIYEAVFYFAQYKQAIIDRERIETQHVQTELSNLRNQINPHFLFNSLNTLMNLIPTDPEAAMNYLTKLSKFYRYAVNAQEEKLIPLSKELEFANLYIDLLKERFRDALEIKMNIEQESDQMIPPLSLQLLLENAVKHNVVSRDMPLEVEISFDPLAGELLVTNNIQRKINSVSSTGIGLENIKKRFQYFTERPVKIIQDLERFQVALPTITS